MKLELKLALIGALSKVVIFFILLVQLQHFNANQALRHTDRDLVKMKDKTLSIVSKIGIKSFLNIEKDSVYASYNLLKDEYITIDVSPLKKNGVISFSNDTREIESEEFDYRILNYTFEIDGQYYLLEIGKNIQLIVSLNKTLKNISITLILIVLAITILADISLNKYLLHPLNQKIIPKLKTITNPETFVYSDLKSSTSDFVYLNNTLNNLMQKVSRIIINQKQFTADVSHELFTPITIMQNKLENLLTSGDIPDHMVPVVIDQQCQLKRMQQIIKALLLIARIENDQYAKNDTVDISNLVNEAILNIQDRANLKNISIENLVTPTLSLSHVNKMLWEMVIFNLISNAIKYNNEGGWIKITALQDDKSFILEVSDNGIGIDQTQIPTLFDRFKRLNPSSGEGHGLGLSIVKSVVQFHGGTIEVNSAIGEGSAFKITLPLKNINNNFAT